MTTDPDSPQPDPDDALDELARLRHRLTRRIESSPRPSRFINQLRGAQVRCREANRQLRRLLEQAPSIHRVVRKALREAFDLDPDRLLFSEPVTPGGPQAVDSLTDRALGLLDNPQFPININRYTTLSLQGDTTGTLPFSVSEVLHKVNALDLPGQIQAAMSGYWQGLAFGSALSREERWVQVHLEAFAERAYLAHALYDLSDHGFAMALGILDAPTPQARTQAGGAWERLQVSPVLWPSEAGSEVPLAGALHIYRSGDALDKRQVVYLPGLGQWFHEFTSLAQMQLKLPALINGVHRATLWQQLPLRRRHGLAEDFRVHRGPTLAGDALRHSALAQLDLQRDNERDCLLARHASRVSIDRGSVSWSASQRLRRVEQARRRSPADELLRVAVEQLLEWDRQRRASQVSCAALTPGLAMGTAEALVRRHEQGLLALLNPSDLSQDYRPFSEVETLQRQWLEHVETLHGMQDGQEHRLGDRAFWLEKRPGSTSSRGVQRLNAQRLALIKDAHLYYRLGLLDEVERMLLTEVYTAPLASDRAASTTRVLQLSIGRARQPLYRLLGVLVVTTREAFSHPERLQPVVLQVPGKYGGFQAFGSLDKLSASLDASLKSPDGSMLWHCIPQDQRRDAREVIQALAASEPTLVYYEAMEGNVLSDPFKEQINRYAQTDRWVGQGGRPFSEVTDLALTRTLLARELADSLRLPLSTARAQAFANISVLRLAVAQANTLPAWLASASRPLRKRYQRLHTHYLASASALEQELGHVLPSLEVFARKTLVEGLKREGLPSLLDIDTPFLDMPDDVSTHWESHPQRPAGDSGVRTVISQERHTYSLLQLALHNLDAEAPWTRQRLHYSHYLEPLWAQHLPAEDLTRLIAGLDLAGQYERLITRTFYPDASGAPASLPTALLERPWLQRARRDHFSARQQGLSEGALSAFSTALAARTPEDLKRNGHHLQLCCVHLAALTLEQPRHVAGVLVIDDRVLGKTLLYWPAVKGYPPLTEHDSVAAARQALMTAALSPGNLEVLAQSIAPGWEAQALESYPVAVRPTRGTPDRTYQTLSGWGAIWPFSLGPLWIMAQVLRGWFAVRRSQPAAALVEIEKEIREQIEQAPQQWLGITPTTGGDLLRMLTHARVLAMQRDVQAVANSARDLVSYRQLRLGEQSAARVRGLLSFIPGVSVGVNLYEVLSAARRFHHSSDARDGIATGFAALILIADVAMTLFPLGKGVPKPGLPVRRVSMVSALNVIRRSPRLPGGGSINPGFARVAKGFRGVEVYRKDLTLEGAVPLNGPINKGSHVKGGQQFVAEDSHAYPVYRRRDESALRLKNARDSGQNELLLTIEEPGEWLLGADAPPTPRAGPSSGIRRPWEAPAGGTEWVAPSASHVERVERQPPLASTHWHPWGRQLNEQAVPEISASRQLHRVPGAPGYDAVKLGSHYYELLPNGSTVPDGVIFLRAPELPSAIARDELARWLIPGVISEQPIPATWGGNQAWIPREPLFSHPLSTSVGMAFPGLTQASQRFVTERLIELADSGRSMTATRILNIRATLDDWLPPAPALAGQTDDLLRMLRPVSRRRQVSVNIGLAGQAPGLERVDFQPPTALDPRLFAHTARALDNARPLAAQAAVRSVLERQGFVLQTLRKGSPATLVNFVCTHPKSNNLYYVLTRWTETPSIALGSGRLVQLSDAWLRSNAGSKVLGRAQAHQSVLRALAEGRLVRIVAGIHHDTRSNSATVYFVKLTDL
ncbi:hypothetical protein HX875_24080 [Pseudomonas yamanorum]|uniref:dermonecrotic toxin domain-containing protein n=1 Tax=Pseudomonas yamanorum TaxID=515393 RepID=UPI0015A2584E|nr:DUF6543 domain-containing protein [Pseudomonas yamanorum]NWE42573.1 hypothetical protein [Pseudomonas yamanorum]